jgi:hypothetical protein
MAGSSYHEALFQKLDKIAAAIKEGGGGSLDSITAGDPSILIEGTDSDPTIKVQLADISDNRLEKRLTGLYLPKSRSIESIWSEGKELSKSDDGSVDLEIAATASIKENPNFVGREDNLNILESKSPAIHFIDFTVIPPAIKPKFAYLNKTLTVALVRYSTNTKSSFPNEISNTTRINKIVFNTSGIPNIVYTDQAYSRINLPEEDTNIGSVYLNVNQTLETKNSLALEIENTAYYIYKDGEGYQPNFVVNSVSNEVVFTWDLETLTLSFNKSVIFGTPQFYKIYNEWFEAFSTPIWAFIDSGEWYDTEIDISDPFYPELLISNEPKTGMIRGEKLTELSDHSEALVPITSTPDTSFILNNVRSKFNSKGSWNDLAWKVFYKNLDQSKIITYTRLVSGVLQVTYSESASVIVLVEVNTWKYGIEYFDPKVAFNLQENFYFFDIEGDPWSDTCLLDFRVDNLKEVNTRMEEMYQKLHDAGIPGFE